MVNFNVNATIPIFDVLALKEDYDEVTHTCNELCESKLLSNDKCDFIIEENEGDMPIDGWNEHCQKMLKSLGSTQGGDCVKEGRWLKKFKDMYKFSNN